MNPDNPCDKLYVGMPYDEIVQLFGEPNRVNPGTEMIEGGPGLSVVASEETRVQLARTQYCMWKRPEGRYLLTIKDGKLAEIHEKPSQSSPSQLLSIAVLNYELTVRIPLDWLHGNTSTGYILRPADAKSLSSPEGPVFSPAILLMSAPIQKPIKDIQELLDGWFDEESRRVTKVFDCFELVSQRVSKVSGCPASWFEFQFDKLNHRWVAIALVVSDGRVVHYADGSFLVSDQSLQYKMVKDVLESFCVSPK